VESARSVWYNWAAEALTGGLYADPSPEQPS